MGAARRAGAVMMVAALLTLSACRPAPEKPPLETAQSLFDQQHYTEARSELMGALQRAPDNAKLHLLNARVHLALNQGAEAEAVGDDAADVSAASVVLAVG